MKPVTISLPDDVASRLEQVTGVSAYVTDEGLARVRARLAELDAYWTPERRRALREEHRREARERLGYAK